MSVRHVIGAPRWLWAALPVIFAALLLASCSSDDAAATATPSAIPSPAAASPTATADATSPAPPALDAEHEIASLGFSLSYPPGWFAETRDTVTTIAELESDFERAFTGQQRYDGIVIVLDHRPLSFMQDLGLPEEPTNEDLFDLNVSFFGWREIEEQGEVSLFGATALVARSVDSLERSVIAAQAVRPIEQDIILFNMFAPSLEALERALPTWEAVLASASPLAATDAGPSSGARFAVGDVELLISCEGSGMPTVVLESALGVDHRAWSRVAREVADFTRVCVYDRAGVGSSDSPASEGRTVFALAEELAGLLSAASVDGPYLVVGHSFGGLVALAFAEQEREQLAALVLVEASHPQQLERFREFLTEEEAAAMVPTRNPEGVDVLASLDELADASALGDLPLVVVTRGVAEPPPPAVGSGEQTEAVWQELQLDLLTLSTNAVQRIATNSGHNVPAEEPQAIVDAIRIAVEHVRNPDSPLGD